MIKIISDKYLDWDESVETKSIESRERVCNLLDTPPESAEGGDVAVGGKTSEVAEALACDVLILPSKQEFTTDDLLRVAQDELARNDDIADQVFVDDVVVASASAGLSALPSRVEDVGVREP
ncbi:hypothetical protein COLO4_27497 [Corchorus olitorius]|uniref:Uncharacterized protein n=1 Tax=Corchorus olitorius TaxID=93759 RepID=A0A1R3HQU4_9ROSI|nr:hypothetical protein COLO4_27497 [Corchorus olitorius]